MLFLQKAPAAVHRAGITSIRIARLFIHVEGGNSSPAQLIILNVAV